MKLAYTTTSNHKTCPNYFISYTKFVHEITTSISTNMLCVYSEYIL